MHDQTLFHLIGFLTSSCKKMSIDGLIYEYFDKAFRKDEFIDYVQSLIKDYFKNIDIENLSYDDSRDQASIRDVLLLFNVITVMRKSSAYSRFPFDSYNKNSWSLEHIHAQNTEGIGNSKELWLAWIDEHLASFKQFTDTYFERLARLEYQSYQMMWKYDSVHKEFEKCAKEHINDMHVRGRLYREGLDFDTYAGELKTIILPVYQAARNCGFANWQYHAGE